MARASTTAKNVRRFRRRCAWFPCGKPITYYYDEALSNAPLRLYCAGTDCAANASRRRRTLERLLRNIDKELDIAKPRSADAERLKRWRRLALWELGLLPGTTL